MDSWLPMEFGNIEDPVTDEERRAMARRCSDELGMTIPAVVDDLADTTALAYQGWPERLYLVGTDGKIAYRGGPGPFGFDPDDFEAAVKTHLGVNP